MTQARAAEPLVQSDKMLQPMGRSLVIATYAAAQSLRIYPLENATVQKTLDELYNVVRRILEREGVLELRVVGDFLFLNDARLRLELSDYAAFAYVLGALSRHGIGRVEMGAGLARQDLAPLLSLLLQDGDSDEESFDRFRSRLAATGVTHVEVEPVRGAGDQPDADEDDQAKEAAKLTYFQSVHVAKEVLGDVRLGRALNLRRVKRAVQSIVDQVLNNETSMLGMTALRDYDEYTFTHCVNVCIISVIMGQKLGLSRPELYELGLGALFHDIGKQRIPAEITNKPGSLNREEWAAMQRHPTEGLLALFGMRGLSEAPYRAMLMAYEHHMKVDLTGYPQNIRPRKPTLFSRIVGVADGFDAATSRRSYQQQPWPPDEVLREMKENPRRGFDPVLVKALINVTGVFPVGTLAILDTMELAVVTARNPDPARVHQPIVKLISDSNGVMLAEPRTVDLAETDMDTGSPRRTVVKTIDPDTYGITISDYFV
ncbi:MAG TPA: HD domain-containing phosphohydrolase [Longimicrobiales bacterium]|nr:HD domain-containing phosphohydrolase [Longimicrobiales bacterium]